LKQHGWFYVEDVCELGDRCDAGAVYSSLKGTDIGPVDTGFVGQRFLRQTLLLPELPQVAREDLTYFHPREASPLKGISPRSILDNRRKRRVGLPTGPVLACLPAPSLSRWGLGRRRSWGLLMNLVAARYLRLTDLLTLWRSLPREEVARASTLDNAILRDLVVLIGRSGGPSGTWIIEASGAAVDALYDAPLAGKPVDRLTPGRADALREVETALETGRPLLLEDMVDVGQRRRRVARLYLPLGDDRDARAQILCGVVPMS